jgi:hypothetical protein
MRKQITRLAALMVAGAGLAGCIDLSGPRLDKNPNSPVQAGAFPLFSAMQGYQFANLTGDYNRLATMWTQQMAGAGRQFLTLDAPFLNDESQFGSWSSFYVGGGLIDIKGIQAQARAAGQLQFLGIAQVWEALVVGTLADYWGDIPYSQASGGAATPTLDAQGAVYAKLQTVLDSAIANLGATGGGPGSADLVFGGNASKWIAVAHTLKARYYLHTAAVAGATAYSAAAAQAALGITSSANDFTTYQSSTTGEQNQWFQFYVGRGTDIMAGKFMIDLLSTRNAGGPDPRLSAYFSPVNGVYKGSAPPAEYDGTQAWLSDTRGDPAFRQPIITWAENQLILAEAQARGGNSAAALTALNAVRTSAGLPALAAPASNGALLYAILEEKYVSLFQNSEVWYDYRRTCTPNLPLLNGAQRIPGRFIYGSDERNANSNVPTPNAAPIYNTQTPRPTTDVSGATCLALKP